MIDDLRKTTEINWYERNDDQNLPLKTISKLLHFINKVQIGHIPSLTCNENYGNCVQ